MVVNLVPLGGEDSSSRPSAGLRPSTAPSPLGQDVRSKPAAAATLEAPTSAVAQAASMPGDAVATASETSGIVSAAAAADDLDDYRRRLYEIVARHSRYPNDAKRLRLAGVTQLAFRLDRHGNVLDSWVQRSSGSEMLDDAALAALGRAQPLPPFPPSLPARMDFVIEIDSSLQYVALLGGH